MEESGREGGEERGSGEEGEERGGGDEGGKVTSKEVCKVEEVGVLACSFLSDVKGTA